MIRHCVLVALACTVFCAPVVAETPKPKPFADFSAKFVKPPKRKTSSKRITVQVTPAVKTKPSSSAPQAVALAKPNPPTKNSGWFWNTISPTLAAQSPARLSTALRHIERSSADASQALAKSTPRLQDLQNIASSYGREIMRASINTRVSPALALAVISVESSGNALAASRAGAQGLMQLMPVTADRFGVRDAFDPFDNISGGVKFLDHLMGRYDSDPMLVLAAYNAGEGSVRDHKGVPPFAETRAYVPKVLAAWSVAKGLCLTQPELLSDGCVFASAGVSQ
ncbi:MAG: lytic transglycosylase domain-containing protein [Pseudomonadota bacterium]